MTATATHKEMIMHEHAEHEAQNESFTAMVCEQAALFGATPGPDEFDNRPVWGEAESTAAVLKAFHLLAEAAPDGTQLADERRNLLWGFVNTLDAQTQRLDRAENLTARRDAFEVLRDTAAEAYRVETGEVWRPRRGSHVSQTGKLTSAVIEARDFQRAKKDRENTAHLPQGTLVAVAGGKEAGDAGKIIAHLDKVKAKYADVVLVHGGGSGAEKIAAGWAERNGVHQVVCKPDWDAHGRAAPFRRNDELLSLLPKGVIAFPGSGITDNLVDKARALGIPVQKVA